MSAPEYTSYPLAIRGRHHVIQDNRIYAVVRAPTLRGCYHLMRRELQILFPARFLPLGGITSRMGRYS